MKLLIDVCVPMEWAEFLRARGFDCVAWLDVGAPTAPDSEIMNRARFEGRVALGPQMLQALAAYETVLASGALVTIETGRTRARILPLGD